MGILSEAHICQCFSRLATQKRNSLVTINGARQKTGQQLVDSVLSLARGLLQLGLRNGDVVAISAFNSDWYLEWILAVAFIGGIVAPLNYRWSFEEARMAMVTIRPKMLVTDESCYYWHSAAQGDAIPSLRWHVSLSSPSLDIINKYNMLTAEMLVEQSVIYGSMNYSFAPEGAVIICFTSGTTGRPKGVVISHTALIVQSLAKVAIVGYSEDDVYLHTAPLCHIGGLSSAMAMLMVGACHAFIPKFEATLALEAIEQHHVTSLITVPAMMADLISSVRLKRIQKGCDSVKKILNGGGGLSDNLIKDATRLFPRAKLFSAYGMTETCSSLTFTTLFEPMLEASGTSLQLLAITSSSPVKARGVCVGKPAPHVEIKICVDGSYNVGRILTRGPHVMLRYWDQIPEKASNSVEETWLDTGDIGFIDDHGNLWLVGRTNGRIKSGGDENDGYSNGNNGLFGFDLTPLYRAYHIHQTLGLEERFKQYYFENRKLQLTSDFQVSSMTPFLESHQTFFAQIAGFFIIEDRILRTGGGLVSKMEVENLWETAVSKMCSVLEDQFSRMQTANHLLLIKDYVSLLGVTLRRYGYPVDALLNVLSKHRDKYHELLLSDCRKQIAEALAADKFEQMLMKKEYEYSMNVLSFQLQASDIVPAFPYVAPFSSTVPDCCRIVRSFIEDSVSFMSFGGQLDFYDVVKKYLDRLLGEVLDGALLKLISSSVHGVSQAMQVAANMAVLERACDFFFRHAAQLSGIPLRMVERGRKQFPLSKARDAAEDMLSGMLKRKVDGFMTLIENVNWMTDEASQGGNEYVNEVIIYLETLVSTAQQILPPQVLKRVLQDVLSHISEKIVGALFGDSVKRFNVNAIMGIDVDIRLLESFADNLSPVFSEGDTNQLKNALAESRQLVNLLLSNHPENFLNPVIREKSYNALDYRKVVTISEKLRDSSDRLFGTFGSRGAKQNPKKKSLDALIKRLKDVS